MTDFRQVITEPAVCEKTTSLMTLQLTDEAGVNLADTAIGVLTLTLYDEATEAIINSRTASNVKNANGGSLSVTGLLTLTLAAADNALTTQSRAEEQHVALLEWTWSSGTKYGKKAIVFTVIEQAKVT